MLSLRKVAILIGAFAVVSCDKQNELKTLGMSQAEWMYIAPDERLKIVLDDIDVLISHQHLCNTFKVLQFHTRACEAFNGIWGIECGGPLLSTVPPMELTDKKQKQVMEKLCQYSIPDNFHFDPIYTLGKRSQRCFKALGIVPNLDGIAKILQKPQIRASALDSIMLKVIQRELCYWEEKGEAQLYWLEICGNRCLLYLTDYLAYIYTESEGDGIRYQRIINIPHFTK